MAQYYFSKTIDSDLASSRERVVNALSDKGFGVLTEIDVAATLKKKLDVDFRPYVILGACSPTHAYRALQAEGKIGAMLPCNVILQETGDGRTEVSSVDPIASMQAVSNESLGAVAREVQSLLRSVIEDL